MCSARWAADIEGIVYDLQSGHRNLQSAFAMQTSARPAPGARTALWLLLAINLFNYIDRQVLASVEPEAVVEPVVSELPEEPEPLPEPPLPLPLDPLAPFTTTVPFMNGCGEQM